MEQAKKDMENLKTLEVIKPGRYRHFKGKEYQVLGSARHSETLEEFVVYRALYGEGELWIRPLAMFFEMVRTCSGETPRFVYMAEE